MSKRVTISIECPHCSNQYQDDFFRTIWGEHESLRNMVMEDRVNIAKCPHCGHKFHLPLAMMYVDVVQGFAVWWEPNHDPGVDSDTRGYAQMFGPDSYYAKAPRIADWNEFKETINKYYRGELPGGKITKFDVSALKKNATQKTSGCLGLLLALLIPLCCLFAYCF